MLTITFYPYRGYEIFFSSYIFLFISWSSTNFTYGLSILINQCHSFKACIHLWCDLIFIIEFFDNVGNLVFSFNYIIFPVLWFVIFALVCCDVWGFVNICALHSSLMFLFMLLHCGVSSLCSSNAFSNF